MARFALHRLVFMCAVLFSVSVITFLIIRLAPGDPARLMAGPQASAEAVEQIRLDLGLDQPLIDQYLGYAGRALRLDFGQSAASGQPVIAEIAARAPATFELMSLALLIALGIGIPLGVLAAIRRGGPEEMLTRSASIIGSAAPAFWLGLLLILLFYRHLDWFPASGRFTGEPPPSVTGFLTIDALLAGDLPAFRIALAHLALPALSMALLELGIYARLVRNQMLGVLSQDYIRVARAGGLGEAAVLREHALRNGLAPLVTIVAASLATMLYGSVSVETVFGWPGAGRYMVDSIFRLDMPVIMGFALITAAAYVLTNTLADIVYAVLDPRVRIA
jgi:peptide/nickel transport system permease protein